MESPMLEGIVQNGVIVFPTGLTLPEGTKVRIEPVAPAPVSGTDASAAADLLRFVGMADDLPTDMALNHDHYLHGAPKR